MSNLTRKRVTFHDDPKKVWSIGVLHSATHDASECGILFPPFTLLTSINFEAHVIQPANMDFDFTTLHIYTSLDPVRSNQSDDASIANWQARKLENIIQPSAKALPKLSFFTKAKGQGRKPPTVLTDTTIHQTARSSTTKKQNSGGHCNVRWPARKLGYSLRFGCRYVTFNSQRFRREVCWRNTAASNENLQSSSSSHSLPPLSEVWGCWINALTSHNPTTTVNVPPPPAPSPETGDVTCTCIQDPQWSVGGCNDACPFPYLEQTDDTQCTVSTVPHEIPPPLAVNPTAERLNNSGRELVLDEEHSEDFSAENWSGESDGFDQDGFHDDFTGHEASVLPPLEVTYPCPNSILHRPLTNYCPCNYCCFVSSAANKPQTQAPSDPHLPTMIGVLSLLTQMRRSFS